jgi:hypothetical protein
VRLLRALLFAGVMLGPAQARAQGVPPGGTYLGELHVDGPTWNFDGDVPAGPGPFQTVTVTNTNCDVPYRPGTAQAGAIIFVAQLSVTPTDTGLTAYNGDLEPFRGSYAHGQVRVLTLDDPDVTTHVDATISNLDDFALSNTFAVCLAAGQPQPGPALSCAPEACGATVPELTPWPIASLELGIAL